MISLTFSRALLYLEASKISSNFFFKTLPSLRGLDGGKGRGGEGRGGEGKEGKGRGGEGRGGEGKEGEGKGGKGRKGKGREGEERGQGREREGNFLQL